MNRTDILIDLAETMIRTKRALHASMRGHGRPLVVSDSQLELLSTISHYETASASSLAKTLGLTPGAISQLVESLVQLELVTRQADPADRRTQLLRVSLTGKKQLESLREHRNAVIRDIMANLTDQELHTLLQLQHKMLAGAQANVTEVKEKD